MCLVFLVVEPHKGEIHCLHILQRKARFHMDFQLENVHNVIKLHEKLE